MSMSSLHLVPLLALMKLPKVGRKSAIRCLRLSTLLSTPSAYWRNIEPQLKRSDLSFHDFEAAWLASELALGESEAAGIEALSIFDELYPQRLKDTPDPPAILFVKGSRDALATPSAVAIVGTRDPTAYGEALARRCGEVAARKGYVVVSGLAHGCDTFAHQGCVEANGAGVAVLAHGLDKVYPAANRDLARMLLDKGGCLVSEYLFGASPARNAFAERDRIQSGLSDGIIVIETGVVGGTMHTVRFAQGQGRPIGAIDHPVKWHVDEKVQGNQMLLQKKVAQPISDPQTMDAFLRSLATDGPVNEDPPVAQKSWAF